MTTILTADIHASANPRDAYRWLFLEETLPRLIKEHGATRLLLLGDMTEAKDAHSAALVNRLVDALARLSVTVSIYVLKGNHDYVAEDAPFFRFLQHVPRVRWINEPTALKLRGLGDCLFLPHSGHPDDYDWTEGYDWYFCHQTFAGANLGRHRAGGAPTHFPPNIKIVSGDVHVPQRLGPITYVGAPYTIDFGDSYEPRVLLLDGDKKPRSIPVPGPQKRLVVAHGKNPLNALHADNKHPLIAGITPLNPGDVVKVRVEMPARTELSRAEVRARVNEWASAAGVHLYATQIIMPEAARGPARAAPQRTPDDELVRSYVRKMKRDKATIAAGLKIVKEVS